MSFTNRQAYLTAGEKTATLTLRLRSQAPEIHGRLLINDRGGRDVHPGAIVGVLISEAHDFDLVGGPQAPGRAPPDRGPYPSFQKIRLAPKAR